MSFSRFYADINFSLLISLGIYSNRLNKGNFVLLEIYDEEQLKQEEEKLSEDMKFHKNFQKVIALRNHNKI